MSTKLSTTHQNVLEWIRNSQIKVVPVSPTEVSYVGAISGSPYNGHRNVIAGLFRRGLIELGPDGILKISTKRTKRIEKVYISGLSDDTYSFLFTHTDGSTKGFTVQKSYKRGVPLSLDWLEGIMNSEKYEMTLALSVYPTWKIQNKLNKEI